MSLENDTLPATFLKLDGSGRKPRIGQIQFLNWFVRSKARIKVGILPVASGKSFIAKALQQGINCSIITCNNILVDQYEDGYPRDNILKGMTHYSCAAYPGQTCDIVRDIFGGCANCTYEKCRDRAHSGEGTVFNPMSLYALLRSQSGEGMPNFKQTRPGLTIVDEAHQLPSMLKLLSSASFSARDYQLPKDITSYPKVLKWLKESQTSIATLMKTVKDASKLADLESEKRKFDHVIHGFSEDQANYAVYIEERNRHKHLVLSPVKVVKSVADRILGTGPILFMSGTLFKTDIEELVGSSSFESFEAPSAIPKEQRPLYYEPAPFRLNYQTDPKLIVDLIEQKIAQNPGLNTIIHVSYALSKRLQPNFTIPILYNDAANKSEKLEEFKREGGVFLAAGCAEGIDLADDLCRLTIVPQLLFPALNDPIVSKRKALPDGEIWYALQVLGTLIQQVGRSTRHEGDRSKSYVFDSMFGNLFARYKKELPKYFTESVVWGTK